MKSAFSDLQLRQTDLALMHWRNAKLPARPSSGWIKSIRQALGMSATVLARRLGVAPSTVTRLEVSEADDTASLGTLRRAAEALGCELQYALVPKESLRQALATRAYELARHRMKGVSHSMVLEDQATSREILDEQTQALAASLLQGPRDALWKER